MARPAPFRGVVVLDTRGGAPVNQVLVRLQGSGRAVTTDDAGRFEIDQVAAGSHELYVSAVDFILVKHTLIVSAGETTDLTIALTDGTGSLTQAVTVVLTSAPTTAKSGSKASSRRSGPGA
jgi:hypothetical protein